MTLPIQFGLLMLEKEYLHAILHLTGAVVQIHQLPPLNYHHRYRKVNCLYTRSNREYQCCRSFSWMEMANSIKLEDHL